MAGTDRSAGTGVAGQGPAIILVHPQMGENIGAAARAMLNCGLTELRLVAPRDGWPNERAVAMASGADQVIEQTVLFETTAEAVADLHRVYASTARPRGMIKTVATPRGAAAEMRAAISRRERCGVLFGPERAGLDNDDVARADAVISVPLNPAYASLNLAQAVLLIAYEWFQSGDDSPQQQLHTGRTDVATKAELDNFFDRLMAELDAGGFLHPPEKRPNMVRNIRNLFLRAGLTQQEVQTLHGIVSSLLRGGPLR